MRSFFYWFIVIFFCCLSITANCGGNGWLVKIVAITQNEHESFIKLRSTQNNFDSLHEKCDEVTLHVKPFEQKWLALPVISTLENWACTPNLRFSPNPISVKATIDAIARLNAAALAGAVVDFGLLSSKTEAEPCHYLVRGILSGLPPRNNATLSVVASYSHF